MYRPEKGHIPILAKMYEGEAVIVRRDEVKGYVNNPEFLQILNYWHYTKLWGLPRGWDEMPMDVLQAITALELESKAIEAEAMEKTKHDNR